MDGQDHSIEVHRSLLEPDLLLGVPTGAFGFLLVAFVLGAFFISLWVAIPVFALLMLFRAICKKDPHLLEIVAKTLSDADVYEK